MEFLREAPEFERMLARDGITLIKFWFSVSRTEQLRRFVNRLTDPVKRWKLSPVDLASLDKWDEYTEAKESMFFFTDLAEAPWTVVKSNDKKRARLEAMRYVLGQFAYADKDVKAVGRPDPLIVGSPSLQVRGDRAREAAQAGRPQVLVASDLFSSGRRPAGREVHVRAAQQDQARGHGLVPAGRPDGEVKVGAARPADSVPGGHLAS
jgi:hypothetical protein